MINFDNVTEKSIIGHNPNCLYIPDHRYQVLISGGFGSVKQMQCSI